MAKVEKLKEHEELKKKAKKAGLRFSEKKVGTVVSFRAPNKKKSS